MKTLVSFEQLLVYGPLPQHCQVFVEHMALPPLGNLGVLAFAPLPNIVPLKLDILSLHGSTV
jgi:hypothetical protein